MNFESILQPIYYYMWQDDAKLLTAAVILTVTLIWVIVWNPQSPIAYMIITLVMIIVPLICLISLFQRVI